MACNGEFWQKRIDATLRLIEAYEEVIEKLLTSNATQSYTLDTGQSRQTVTRADISRLQSDLDVIYNRYDMLCVRKNGGGTTNMGAAW